MNYQHINTKGVKTDEWDKTDLNQIPDLKRSQQREVNMAEI